LDQQVREPVRVPGLEQARARAQRVLQRVLLPAPGQALGLSP
jgi:hypothetical protein